MDTDEIAEVGVDDHQRLYVKPSKASFPYIYREAMEVHWDSEGKLLYAPPPPRALLAEPLWWFERIISAAKAQDCCLVVSQNTRWHQVPPALRNQIESRA